LATRAFSHKTDKAQAVATEGVVALAELYGAYLDVVPHRREYPFQ